jgi:hypothetical protein
MAQRDPVWAKLRFKRRAVGAALDQRGARSLVETQSWLWIMPSSVFP